MSVNDTGVVTALFRPTWGGGWLFARVLFAVEALDLQKDRWWHVRDALAHPSVVFNAGPAHVADHVLVGPLGAWSLWLLGFVGIAGMLFGGRWAKPGLWVWFLGYAALLVTCGLNVRVPERFIVWATLALSLGPIGERGLVARAVSPFGRYVLLLVYTSLYLSTGVMKALEEPTWWDGTAISYDLVDRWHSEGALPALLSGIPWVCFVASWYTILFEVLFCFFIGFRRTSLAILLMGVGMHLAIDVLLEVGPLGMMAMAFYPVLLHPGVGEGLWRAVERRWPAGSRRVAGW